MGGLGSVAMWCLMLVLCWQDPQTMEPERINGKIFLRSGKIIDLANIRIKGVEPYVFEFYAKGESSLVSILRVARITKMKDGKSYEVLFDSGEKLVGRIGSLSLIGVPIGSKNEKDTFFALNNLDRVHFILGNQLRACFKGHYEEYTPYPFCPVCGNELAIGPYMEDESGKDPAQPRYHLLRLDARDPSSTAPGRRQ